MNGAACFNVDYLKTTRTQGRAQDAEAAQGERLQVTGTRFACLTGPLLSSLARCAVHEPGPLL